MNKNGNVKLSEIFLIITFLAVIGTNIFYININSDLRKRLENSVSKDNFNSSWEINYVSTWEVCDQFGCNYSESSEITNANEIMQKIQEQSDRIDLLADVLGYKYKGKDIQDVPAKFKKKDKKSELTEGKVPALYI